MFLSIKEGSRMCEFLSPIIHLLVHSKRARVNGLIVGYALILVFPLALVTIDEVDVFAFVGLAYFIFLIASVLLHAFIFQPGVAKSVAKSAARSFVFLLLLIVLNYAGWFAPASYQTSMAAPLDSRGQSPFLT